MVQGYYTVEEAARILGMDTERLTQMAQKRDIRAFADRGTWRFRTQDVEEMARRLGLGSNPDLQLGEPDRPRAAPSPAPKSGPKGPSPSPGARAAKPGDEGVFDFSLGSTPAPVDLEHDIVIESPSGQGRGSKPPAALSPTPKPGSDSDVHLVFDVGADYAADSNVKLSDSGRTAKSPGPRGPIGITPEPTARGKRPPGARGGSQLDSGVRLVPMDEDSAVPLGQVGTSSGTDSDIRLDRATRDADRGAAANLSNTTEDINLDEELRKAEELAKATKPRSKAKPASKAKPPAEEAAFELVETGLEAPRLGEDDAGTSDATAELKLDDDDQVNLGAHEAPGEVGGSTNVAGINLAAPADSGLNLEKKGQEPSSDSLEFELSLEPSETAGPITKVPEADSSGEFELTLEENPAAPGGVEAAGASEEDIFETDFDMPAAEQGEASAAVGADTELESSDFELSLGEGDSEDSGSQVVALEGEEADEAAQTVAYKGRKPIQEVAEGEAAEEELEDLLGEDELGELEAGEEEAFRAPRVVAAPTANWGALPAVLLFPCVIVMFLLTCMSFELLNNMWAYRQSTKPAGGIVRTFAELLGDKLPD